MELKVPRSSIWQELLERRLSPNVPLSKGKEDSGACVEVSDQMLALEIRHNWKIHKYSPPELHRMNCWSLVVSWRKPAESKGQIVKREKGIVTKRE